MTINLDSFLTELQSEGRLDSQGKFTLDLGHAREKLARYLLENTEDVLLKLVQAGVAAGASKLSLESKSTHINFTMYGAVFPNRALAQILSYLLDEGQVSDSRALQHLAMAVNTAVTTRPTAIALAEWNGTRGTIYRWSKKGKEVAPWQPGRAAQPLAAFQLLRTAEEHKGNLWHLWSQRDIWSMLFGTKGGWDPDRLLLHQRAAWCPIPLLMNGKVMIESPLLTGIDRASQATATLLHKEEFRLPGAPDSPGIRTTTRRVKPMLADHEFPTGPCAAVITVGKESPKVQVPSLFDFTVDGVTVQSVPIYGAPKGTYVRAIAAADGYKTDITGLKLIQTDQQLYELSNRVLEHAARLFPGRQLGALPNLYLAR